MREVLQVTPSQSVTSGCEVWHETLQTFKEKLIKLIDVFVKVLKRHSIIHEERRPLKAKSSANWWKDS